MSDTGTDWDRLGQTGTLGHAGTLVQGTARFLDNSSAKARIIICYAGVAQW